ncbi:hypothetical protein F2Q70_00041907 [Brassica cretica]|uniref:Uncharacterized protein n=1 Tax=Brassica cretica TaxID=69181 RepID=A0A8S9K683_BRACR|nr:hypothetical protein F2Q70_00041907 [Brassica cretica]
MGGCVSTPKSCVGSKMRSKRRKSRKRRKLQRKRAAGSFDNLDHPPNNLPTPSFRGLDSLS